MYHLRRGKVLQERSKACMHVGRALEKLSVVFFSDFAFSFAVLSDFVVDVSGAR